MKLLIRADANEVIASGHIMRCLSIAQGLKRQQVECVFVTADCKADAILENSGFGHIVLNSDWRQKSEELPILGEVIKREQPQGILVDSYEAGAEYFSELKKLCPVAYIASVYDVAFTGDLLLNYSQFQKQERFKKEYPELQEKGFLLQGERFAPLREQFKDIKRQACGNLKKVLITTGASDRYHVARELLCACMRDAELGDIEYTIIIGKFSDDAEKLELLAKEYPKLRLLYQVTDMAAIMSEHDAAVSAGGTTLFELCACGLPAISFAIADNQLPGVRYFDEQAMIFFSGDIREEKEESLLRIREQLKCWKRMPEQLQSQAEKMQRFVDGKGADRIAEKLIEMMGEAYE